MSILTISTPATSRGLLTAAELRAAAGVAAGVTARDTELAAIGLTVADTISDWCRIAGDGLTPVTLLRETVVETFRLTRCVAPLILARRFLGTVTIVEDDVALEATDFAIGAGAGLLTRLTSDDTETHWSAAKIVVTYQAGFATVPTTLASVAAEMVGRKTGALRDPMTRMERVETTGVEITERQFWVDAAQAVEITPDMETKLAKYATPVVG